MLVSCGTQVVKFELQGSPSWIGILFEAIEYIDAGALGEAEASATSWPEGEFGWATAPAQSRDGWGLRVLPRGLRQDLSELQGDVFVLDEADGGSEGGVAGEEEWFGVSDAERSEASEPAEEFRGDIGEGKLGAVADGWFEDGCGEARDSVAGDAGAEGGKAGGG